MTDVVTAHTLTHKMCCVYQQKCRSQWPRGLRLWSAAARPLRSWVRIPPGAWMSVCCECCVLSGRGLCDELITRPEESYRLWCLVVCDLENLKNEEAMTRVGSQRHKKKLSAEIYLNNSDTRDFLCSHLQNCIRKGRLFGNVHWACRRFCRRSSPSTYEDPRLGFSQFNRIIAWASPRLSFRRCNYDVFFDGVHRVRGEPTLTSSMSVEPPVSVRRYSHLRNTQKFGKIKHAFPFPNAGSVITGTQGFRACRHTRRLCVSFSFDHSWARLCTVSLSRLTKCYIVMMKYALWNTWFQASAAK